MLLAGIERLLDTNGNFRRLTKSVTHMAVAITQDHERAERHLFSALSDLRDTADADNRFNEPAGLRFRLFPAGIPAAAAAFMITRPALIPFRSIDIRRISELLLGLIHGFHRL